MRAILRGSVVFVDSALDVYPNILSLEKLVETRESPVRSPSKLVRTFMTINAWSDGALMGKAGIASRYGIRRVKRCT